MKAEFIENIGEREDTIKKIISIVSQSWNSESSKQFEDELRFISRKLAAAHEAAEKILEENNGHQYK